MKRRFRITITPDAKPATFRQFEDWVKLHFKASLMDVNVRFKVSDFYCAGIEVTNKAL